MADVTMKLTMKNVFLTLETAVNFKFLLGNAQIVYAMKIKPGIPFGYTQMRSRFEICSLTIFYWKNQYSSPSFLKLVVYGQLG